MSAGSARKLVFEVVDTSSGGDDGVSLRIAVHGFVAEGAGSGAGSFPLLFERLLELGHRVDFWGIPGLTETPSLARRAGYRYFPMSVPDFDRWWKPLFAVNTPYPRAAYAQLGQIVYHREAVRLIERESRTLRYDAILCANTSQLWRSRIPVLSWPQGPPHTELEILRSPDVAAQLIAQTGRRYHRAVQLFYAYRWLQNQASWRFSDRIICSTGWVQEEWRRFGVSRERLRHVPYALDLQRFANVPPPGRSPDQVTYLWLGRAVPRKRFDLFSAAFELVADQHADARAIVAGQVDEQLLDRLRRGRHASKVELRNVVPSHAVPALFAEADVLVQPSQNEPFGFAVIEALSAGRPVVVGPTNGVSQYGGAARFSFSNYTALEVAAAMIRAREAVRARGQRLSELARRQAWSNFEVGHVARLFCNEIAELGRTTRG